jgi:hypothetical protein
MGATLNRKLVPDALANMVAFGQTMVSVDGKGRQMEIDPSLEPEFHTDKDAVKIVPCRNPDCKRPIVVTTFFTPEKALCRVCDGESGGDRTGSLEVVAPGQTDPAKAANLADCLINPQFAEAVCPICVTDMELKSVSHNDHYGPSVLTGYKNGIPEYRQTAPGESVMFQCEACKCVITMTTTAQVRYKRKNEPKADTGIGANRWGDVLGVREEPVPA